MAEREVGLPRWLGPANRVVVALQRRGLVIGTMRVLSVPGRKTGTLCATPVSPLRVEGRRYIVAALEGADWGKIARAAGGGFLARGREEERVALVEVPVGERAAVLREFPDKVPGGVRYFRRLDGVSRDPEVFAERAPRCPVFRVEGAP